MALVKPHVPAVRAIVSESNNAVTDALYRQACIDKGVAAASRCLGRATA